MSVMNVHVRALISTALGLFVSNALAGDMAECSKLADKDKKAFCMASYAASGTYCGPRLVLASVAIAPSLNCTTSWALAATSSSWVTITTVMPP